MTRTEFIDCVNDFRALIDFCNDNGIDICDGIYSEDERDDVIENELYDNVREYGWRSVKQWLDEIETGFDWYVTNEHDWVGLDDEDFERYKDDVESYCLGYDCFDDEDEDEEEEPYAEPQQETEPPIEAEDCSMNDLFASGFCSIRALEEQNEAAEHEADKAFNSMIF